MTDTEQFESEMSSLLEICKNAGGFTSARPLILETLKSSYDAKRENLAQEFQDSPQTRKGLKKEYTAITDHLLLQLFQLLKAEFPDEDDQGHNKISMIAVGGYGRIEMAPHSDIDLLFLLPDKQTKWHETFIETMLYFIWDLGLKLGQSVRSIAECLNQAQGDITIRTSLLEQRFLAGDEAMAADLVEMLRIKLFVKSIPEFIEAKLEEREQRHQKSGNIRYVLEPNVKEAKGGLRDLQTLYWLGKYITGADTPEELLELGFFQPDELAEFKESEDFLWTVRHALHQISGRANDLLSFDMQVEVAQFLGFEATEGRRAVEVFMQSYFRAARQVGEITRVFITELEARHVWKSPSKIKEFLSPSLNLPEAFAADHRRINFASENAVTEDPLNMLRIFALALEHDRLIHPNAFRYMARHTDLIDDKFRASKEANRLFMSLLLDYGNPERALRRMNEIGFLGQFIPPWAHIDAMMQYNMYHSYTVDEHTIQCISNLADIEKKLLIEDLPVATGILKNGVNRRVLYIALLLHDIGKGMLRPHEDIGSEIAAEIAPRFGLERFEVEQVVWLVRYHLEMSDAAQKRDLSDPKTISDFAELVGDQEKLDLLTVLTVCDIRGVGPKTWNNWKAVLIRELHALTYDALEQNGVLSGSVAREKLAKSELSKVLAHWDDSDLDFELGRHYTDYWLSLSTEIHAELAELLRTGSDSVLGLRFSLDNDRDATRICFVMPDHPGLFARLCGAVSLSGASIVDARTYTSSDGMAMSVLWVQDGDGACYAPSRQDALSKNVTKILRGELVAGEAIAERSRIKKRERQFNVPTKIRFDNDGSDIYTIIEIETRDSMGLLYDIARTLVGANISISSAIIATYGEEAIDSFYVKDLFGQKIYSKAKQKMIEERLRKAIEQGYQEALQ